MSTANDSVSINQVPWLRSGVGKNPSDGGCIMQVIDWIHRNKWTDAPPCVHPVIRRLAICANDALDDAGRQELLTLAPRMMNTNSDDRILSVRLSVFCSRRVLPIFEKTYPDDSRPRLAIEAAEAWCDDPSEENAEKCGQRSAAANAAYSAAYSAATAVTAAYSAAYAADSAAYSAASAVTAAYSAAYAAAYSAATAASAYSGGMKLLLAILDEYDRLTGRGDSEDLDFSLLEYFERLEGPEGCDFRTKTILEGDVI